MNRNLACLLLGCFFSLSFCQSAQSADWNPSKTWVFAIGCMEWKFDRKSNMPKKGRQDSALVDALKKAGVPAKQVVYLPDKQGTIAAITDEFSNLLNKTQKGDFLIFYFCGHGTREITAGKSQYFFANYDSKDTNPKSWLSMDFVFNLIESRFKGSHVLMTADCCFSGGMLELARNRKAGITWACMPSVYGHNASTGDWTFTKGLINGFSGKATSDINGDGKITFGEMAEAIERDMAFIEKQKSVFLAVNGFDPAMKVLAAEKKAHPDVGKFVEVKQANVWYLSQVLGYTDDKFQINYVEFEGPGAVASVPAKRIRELTLTHHKEGTKVEAKNVDDKWLPAVVKSSKFGLHFVRFDSDRSGVGLLDEWVPLDRIRLRK